MAGANRFLVLAKSHIAITYKEVKLIFRGAVSMWERSLRCIKDIWQLVLGWLPVFGQTIYGLVKISRLSGPRITFFGGARFGQDEPYAQAANNLAMQLAAQGYAIMTGGGAGIMEAANCGVSLHSTNSYSQTIGIMVADLPGEQPNNCAQEQVVLNYFWARKWLLTRYATGFVVFPGGFGTLDELTELITLIKTKQLEPAPIILFGVAYWQGLIEWLNKTSLACGTVTQADLNLIILTDSPQIVLAKLAPFSHKI